MKHSPRIMVKILTYSKIFKAMGIIDEEVYNEITSRTKGRRKGH